MDGNLTPKQVAAYFVMILAASLVLAAAVEAFFYLALWVNDATRR
jgi:hypothetical protein